MFLKILQVYRTFHPDTQGGAEEVFGKFPTVLFTVVASAKS
jgi:hypothetical protein